MASVQAPAPPTSAALRRRTRRKSRTMPTVIGLVALLGAGWWGWQKTHPAPADNGTMLTAAVSRGDLIESVSATGSVTAQTGASVKIGSQITGTIKRLYADVGTTVKAGDVIAELNLPDIQANLDQAQANLAAARTRLLQQQTGESMTQTQSSSGVSQAQAELVAAQARLRSAEAASRLQTAQTPTDIARAQSVLQAAKAALSTALSNQVQTKAGANLQIATSQETLNQAKANATNSSANLKRQQALVARGFVATSAVDAATAQDAVYQSQVTAAQQNIELTRQKVAADLQSASDAVTQAQQNVGAAQAALVAAQAGTYSNDAKVADVQNARAAVGQAQATLKLAQGNTTQNALKGQDIQQAQEAIKQSQAQVDYAKAQVDKTFIRSPISGTVTQLASQQGETLAAGLSAPTLIVVTDLSRLQVDVYVDETDIGKLKKGQEADITVDAFPKRPFKGHVTKVAAGSTIQQGVVTYDVTLAIDNPGLALKPDMTASVNVQTGKRTNVLLVPAEAVKVSTRGATVNVLTQKDGKPTPEPRPVKTGGSDGVKTEIKEGLKEGETIVRAGGDEGRRGGGGGGNNPFGPSGGKGKGGGGGGGGGKGKGG